ncbi:MAG TPA: dihydrodipicolinate synthase family protein [Terriglobia bacterium]|nr:dihydrodipicolinate synthase family protein [Terriglobia bacterium]
MTHTEVVEKLRGVFPPLVTPMNRRGGLDEGAFRANLRRYAASGLSGAVVAGSTGEAPFLTEAERLRLVEIARSIIKPPKLLIAGTGLESTAQTTKLSREAIARGADAVLLLPPAYYKAAMNPETLSIHFRAVADALRRPILIYSIPQFTGYAMDAGMLGKLSRYPNIAGLKESSGNLDFVRAILAKARPGFKLLIGSGLIFPQGLGEGAAGGILGQSNFAPQLCVAIYEAFSSGDMKTAEELRQKLLILVQNVTGPYGIPGIKAALDLVGYRGGNPRPPFMPVSAQVKKKIAAALKQAGVEG